MTVRGRTRRGMLAVVVAAIAAIVAVAAILADHDADPVRAPGATAPLAPAGVPARPAEAVSEEPGGGVEVEEARTVELGLPAPGDFAPGTPRRALAQFLDAWHDRAWDRMALWTTRAWRSEQRDAGAALRDRFGPFRLLGWAFEDVARQGPAATATVLTAQRDLEPRIVRERLRFALARPEGGRWGVLLAPDAQ